MRKKLIAGTVLILMVSILAYGVYYVNDYYHAQDSAVECLNGSGNVSVIKTDNGLLLDGPGNDSAIIFYPGAKVEYTSYLPLLTRLSNDGIDCFLVEMPFNLAFLGQNSADEIIDGYDYDHYFLAGHSLGGAMASKYVNSTNRSDGLILLASYSTDEISKPVLSVYGSNDRVLNMEKYQESRHFIGKNLTEIKIEGANHAQIGNYGNQSGDGDASISSERQQELICNAIVKFADSFTHG